MFWHDLAAEDRRALEEVGTSRHYPAGSVVFLEGAESSFVLVITSGSLKLTTAASDGREVIIEMRGRGDLIGELGAVDRSPRSATAVAIGDLGALIIRSEDFRRLLVDRGSLAFAVLSLVAERLRSSVRRQLELGTSDVLARLCSRLVELAADGVTDAEGAIEVSVPLTQQEMAEWIGVSRDAVVLALGHLREAGLVETGRKRVKVLDLTALEEISAI